MVPSAPSGGGSTVAGAFRRRTNSRRGEWAWIEQQDGKDREGKDGTERLHGRDPSGICAAKGTDGTCGTHSGSVDGGALAFRGRDAPTKSTGFPWTGEHWLSVDGMRRHEEHWLSVDGRALAFRGRDAPTRRARLSVDGRAR